MRKSESMVLSLSLLLFLVACAGGKTAKPATDAPRERAVESRMPSISAQNPADRTHEWLQCTDGTGQSPIDLPSLDSIKREGSLKPLVFDYEPSPVQPYFNGDAVQIDYKPGSFLLVGDDLYELEQLHFHTPGEHTAGGRAKPAELQLVHQNSKGEYAVVAVLLSDATGESKASAYAPILASISAEREPAKSSRTFNAKDLIPNSPGYIQYTESLTTPPCSEKVQWYVLGSAVKLNRADIEKLHAITGDNARPAAALQGRQLKIGPAVTVK